MTITHIFKNSIGQILLQELCLGMRKKSLLPLKVNFFENLLFYLKDVSCNGVGNIHSGEREAIRFHE